MGLAITLEVYYLISYFIITQILYVRQIIQQVTNWSDWKRRKKKFIEEVTACHTHFTPNNHQHVTRKGQFKWRHIVVASHTNSTSFISLLYKHTIRVCISLCIARLFSISCYFYDFSSFK